MNFKTLLSGLCLLTFYGTGVWASSGELNAYTAMSERYTAPIFEAFTAKTGIKVNYIRLSSGEVLARLMAEKNNPRVDVFFDAPADTFVAAQQDGLFQPYKSPTFDLFDEKMKDPEGYWTGFGVIPLCVLTNREYLKKHNLEVPTSWDDLLDPAFKKSFQLSDARTSGTACERLYNLIKVYGEDGAFEYQKKLNENVQLYTKSGAGGAMPVGAGQAAGGIFYISDAIDVRDMGYPVAISYPKEGVTYGIEPVAMIKDCKNPEEAKKFIDWVTSEDFAHVMIEKNLNYVPTYPNIKTTEPLLDLSKINLIETDTVWKGENRQKYVDRWINEVVK